MRKIRRNVAGMEEKSRVICMRAIALLADLDAKNIFCYASFSDEPETDALLRWVLSEDRRLYVPRVCGLGIMEAVRVTDLNRLHKNRGGIREPADGECCAPEQLDAVIVPGLAFDRSGNRLGYGGGYYDRYLAGTDAVRIALAYDACVIPLVTHGEFDKKMDYLLTERETLHTVSSEEDFT